MGGDFNYVADLQLDRTYKKGMARLLTSHSYTALHDLFNKYGMIDCWRQLNPTVKDYTYYSTRHDVFSRLDYCLILKPELHKLKHSEIGCKLLTDHNWLSCDFSPSTTKVPDFNWMLNRNLLCSQILRQDVTAAIKSYLEFNDDPDCRESIKWDALKATLRGTLISTTTFIKRLRNEEIAKLLSSIAVLEERHKRTGNKTVYTQLQQHCKALEVLETDKIKKNLLYLKQKHWTKSPKALKMLTWRVR